MSLSVAVQMDPIDAINPLGDSSFALMLEAQARGHKLSYYTPSTLAQRGNRVSARAHRVSVDDKEKGLHFTLEDWQKTDLADFDVILLRQDPPFDMNYITTTHMLEVVHPQTLVVNHPREVRNAPEKILVTGFPELMPETLITRDESEIRAFRAEFGDIVLKPLFGNGGAGVFRITPEDQNLGSLLEMFAANFREPFMVQRYLPEVRKGDKRIILVDGKAVAALNRVPAEG